MDDVHEPSLTEGAVLGSAPVGLIALDPDGLVQEADMVAATLLGSTPDDLRGAELHTYLHADTTHPADGCPFRSAVDGGVRRGEERIRRPDGHAVGIGWQAGPLRRDGRVSGTVVTLADLGERAEVAARDRFLVGLERELRWLEGREEIMATVARLVGEHLECDSCAYAEADDDEDHVTVTGSYARGLPKLTGRMAMSDLSAETLSCMRAGEPYVVADAHSDPRVLPEQRLIHSRTAGVAVIWLPLHRRSRFVAALAVHHATARVWTAAEIELLTIVVDRCWESLQRVHAVGAVREPEVTDVPQRGMLPARLPALDRLAAAARYIPAAEHALSGGDWYDMVPLAGTRVALVVGDVVGHGPAAAAVMGRLRRALAAQLLHGSSPAAALERLDRVASRIRGSAGSTCACLVHDWSTGELRWALAGHPPVLLVDADGPRFLEGGSGPVLGIRGRYPEAAATLEPGASVLLYTDGLIERRDEPLDRGLDRLAAAADQLGACGPAELVDGLVDAMLPGAGPADDMALLLVRAIPAPLSGTLPAAARSMRSLRRALAGWIAAAGVGEETADDLNLAIGEAAANAAEHAYRGGPGQFDYTVARAAGGALAVQVRDHGRWRPVPDDIGFRGHGLRVMRELGEQLEIDSDGDGTTVRFRVPARQPVQPVRARPPAVRGTPRKRATLRRRDVAGAAMFVIGGDLDLAGRDEIGPALLAAAAGGEPVFVDITAVRYLSSAGVALLAEAAAIPGPTLSVVVAAGSAPARILQLTGLAGTLPVTVRGATATSTDLFGSRPAG